MKITDIPVIECRVDGKLEQIRRPWRSVDEQIDVDPREYGFKIVRGAMIICAMELTLDNGDRLLLSPVYPSSSFGHYTVVPSTVYTRHAPNGVVLFSSVVADVNAMFESHELPSLELEPPSPDYRKLLRGAVQILQTHNDSQSRAMVHEVMELDPTLLDPEQEDVSFILTVELTRKMAPGERINTEQVGIHLQELFDSDEVKATLASLWFSEAAVIDLEERL